MRIRITTDRLPQPERHKGAEIDVTPEKAAAMVAQGFAVILDVTPAAPEPDAPEALPEPAAPLAAVVGTRRRRGETAL